MGSLTRLFKNVTSLRKCNASKMFSWHVYMHTISDDSTTTLSNTNQTTAIDIDTDAKNLIKPFTSDVNFFAPALKPTFTFAAYIDESPLLQAFFKLGVNLFKLEQQDGVPELLLRLDFDKDVKPYLLFLTDHGVKSDELGRFLTRNPRIFAEDMDNLHKRLRYLTLKNFDKALVANILVKNPLWVNFKTQEIDQRLGYFQKTFNLRARDIRQICWSLPQLITHKRYNIELNSFAIKEELGIAKTEIKSLITNTPKLWMINQQMLIHRFEYLNKQMGIAHERILETPQILYYRKSRVQPRHEYLMRLNRAQYEPSKENYVPLYDLVACDDVEFCLRYAKTSVEQFNMFLKWM